MGLIPLFYKVEDMMRVLFDQSNGNASLKDNEIEIAHFASPSIVVNKSKVKTECA
jgi:hypothetical protein